MILAANPLLSTRVKIQSLCLALVLLSASSPEREISTSISDKVKIWLVPSGPILHPKLLLSSLSLAKSPQSPLVQTLYHSSEDVEAMESSHLSSGISSIEAQSNNSRRKDKDPSIW